ncbi:zinc finger, CCHC-type containing protein, partial [Tanacetum coccineum]
MAMDEKKPIIRGVVVFEVLLVTVWLKHESYSGGRNNNHRKKTNAVIDIGTSVVMEPDGMMNDANPRVDASAAMKDVSPSVVVVDETVAKEKAKSFGGYKWISIQAICDRFANTSYGFFWGRGWHTMLLLTMLGTLGFIRNNPFILKKWHPDENLLKEDVSTIPVWVKLHGVPVTAFSDDGLSVIATKLGTPLMLNSYTADMCMQSWGRSSYARLMIELRADVELKDNIVVAMPIIKGDGYYTCNNRVEYEWKPLRCACCKVFRHVHEECPKNIGAGATKNLKRTSQTPKGIPVGQKMGFKPRQVFQPVSKKSTVNTCGKKMNNSV